MAADLEEMYPQIQELFGRSSCDKWNMTGASYTNRGFYAKWVLANAIGGAIGFTGLFVFSMLGFLTLITVFLAGFLLGLFWGVSQWYVLRESVSLRWVLATTVGIGLGWLGFVLLSVVGLIVAIAIALSPFADSDLLERIVWVCLFLIPGVFAILATGFVPGILQTRLFFHSQPERVRRWTTVNTISTVLAWSPVVTVVALAMVWYFREPVNPGVDAGFVVIAFLAYGFVAIPLSAFVGCSIYGAITGAIIRQALQSSG